MDEEYTISDLIALHQANIISRAEARTLLRILIGCGLIVAKERDDEQP
jgi:hypothetical protein